jgi:DNA-binding PadR family transcriptional regulator
MSGKENERVDLLQGTLDLLSLKQGTLYPALVRLEQNGWIRGSWRKTQNNRDAKYYSLSKAGERAIEKETERWLLGSVFYTSATNSCGPVWQNGIWRERFNRTWSYYKTTFGNEE